MYSTQVTSVKELTVDSAEIYIMTDGLTDEKNELTSGVTMFLNEMIVPSNKAFTQCYKQIYITRLHFKVL